MKEVDLCDGTRIEVPDNPEGPKGPKGEPGQRGGDLYRERILGYAIDGVKYRIRDITDTIRIFEMSTDKLKDFAMLLRDYTEELQFLESLRDKSS